LVTFYNLSLHNVKLHYVLGNHEVVIGNFLRNLGFVIYSQEAMVELDGKQVYLAHGNKIDRRLWTIFWENLLTSKINHTLYSLLHPDIGVFLAQAIAHFSREQPRSHRLSLLLEKFAREKLKDFDIVILAHTHIPVFKVYPVEKYYLNTGDWINHFSYGKMVDSKISLNYYK
ncbi:MAG: hypothetical protein ABIL46_04785, partial [candidate division WOR-3 bacterium]